MRTSRAISEENSTRVQWLTVNSSTSKLLVARLAQQIGARPAQTQHRCSKRENWSIQQLVAAMAIFWTHSKEGSPGNLFAAAGPTAGSKGAVGEFPANPLVSTPPRDIAGDAR